MSVADSSESKALAFARQGTGDTEEGLEDDSADQESASQEEQALSATCGRALRFVGCLLWGTSLLLLAFLCISVLPCTSSDLGGGTEPTSVDELVVPENSSGLPSPCPCPCSRDHAQRPGVLPLLPTLAPLGAGLPGLSPTAFPGAGPAPALGMAAPPPPLLPGLVGAPQGLCVEGADCAYGPGWCQTMATPVKFEQPVGYCHRGACNGPTVASYPRVECSNTQLAQLNVTDFLHDLPKYWLRSLKDVPEFNAWIGRVLNRNGLKGLELDFDGVLLKYFDIQLGEASGVWFMGCWPPQRYAVASGIVRAPSGRLHVRAGGLSFVVSAYDLSLRFWRLRADIQCHDGWYTIGSVTHGKEAEEFPPEALEAHGEFNIFCESTYTVMCMALALAHRWVSREVVKALPQVVATLVRTIDQLEVSPGCAPHMHNVFHLLPYESKACCEEVFAEDEWGCQVGGQFNGKVPGVAKYVRGVECEPSRAIANTFTAKCSTVPGGYEEVSPPGVCREAPIPWTPVDGVDPAWSRVLWILHLVGWVDLALTVAVGWTLIACCCCPLLCGPKWREKSEISCAYRHYAKA